MNDMALPKVDLADPTCVVCDNIAMQSYQGEARVVYWCNTCGALLVVDCDDAGRLGRANWQYPTNATYVPPPPPPRLPPAGLPTLSNYEASAYTVPAAFLAWMRKTHPDAVAYIDLHLCVVFDCWLYSGREGWMVYWPQLNYADIPEAIKFIFWHPPELPNAVFTYVRSHPDRLKP